MYALLYVSLSLSLTHTHTHTTSQKKISVKKYYLVYFEQSLPKTSYQTEYVLHFK